MTLPKPRPPLNPGETRAYPVLPLRDIVVFPHMIVPLFVGREKSVAALEAAMTGDKDIFLLAQLDPGCDDPDRDDLYDTGVIATVLQLLKLPDGTVRVLVEGQQRARLESLRAEQGASGEMLIAQVEPIGGEEASGAEVSAMISAVSGIALRSSRSNRPARRPMTRATGPAGSAISLPE